MEYMQCMWIFVRVLGWKTGSVCGDLWIFVRVEDKGVRVEDMQCMWIFVRL